MSFNLTSSQAIIFEGGAGASSTYTASGAYLAKICDHAEGALCSLTGFNWIASSLALVYPWNQAVSECVAKLAGQDLIKVDMANYTSRMEAQTMLDFMRDKIGQLVDQLKQSPIRVVAGVE